jgi:hypothetical protein
MEYREEKLSETIIQVDLLVEGERISSSPSSPYPPS